MLMNPIFVNGTLTLLVSQTIDSTTKTAALDLAASQMNERHLELSKLVLQDEQGQAHKIYVENVQRVKWLYAESTEYNDRFKITGKIVLGLSMEWDAEIVRGLWETWRLQENLTGDNPILVFSAGNKHVFMKIERQDLEWNYDLKHRPGAGYLSAI